MLEIRLLGQFEVRRDGNPVQIPSRPAQSLLAYLSLTAGTSHRREKLAGLLWPDSAEENARSNLRFHLWRLRKAIEATPTGGPAQTYFLADDISIAFDAHADYWLDVSVLDRAASEQATTDDLIGLLAQYRGELLPGFYEDWVFLERERLQAVFEKQMQRLLDGLVQQQRWAEVLDWGEHWIAFGQTPEPAYRALMLAHGARGDISKVATTYQRCRESLRKEVGVEPSEQTRALLERLTRTETAAPTPEALPITATRPSQPVGADEPPTPGEPPFKGLQYYEEADADLFFGREAMTAKLVEHLHHISSPVKGGEGSARFLAVIGASGSGKSSIVRAGVIPALKREMAPAEHAELPSGGVLSTRVGPAWRIHVLTPTAHPIEALATILTRGSESVKAAAALVDALAGEPRSLYLYVYQMFERGTAGSTDRLLLIIDQFEELFTLCGDEFEREAFVDNLLTAVGPGTGPAATVLITLRADFYAHLAQYPELREAVAKQQEYIGPMSEQELRRAIEEPARCGQWEFEPGLVDLILRDAGDEPGALPLLSHALLETWKRRSGHTLTLKGYAEAGGVRGAIAQSAERTYQQLSSEQQALARNIFLRLTDLGEGTEDTRRRASFDELIPRGDEAMQVRQVLTTLADARLITLGKDSAEVAHEALIREWDRLREWLNADREGLRLHRHLTEAAEEWERLNREPGALYRGAHLAQAREWATANPEALNAQERAFLEASQDLAEREAAEREAHRGRELEAARKLADQQNRAARQLRRRAYILASAFVLAVVLAGIALFAGEQARVNAVTAQENAKRADQERQVELARELAASSVSNLDVDPERSILLALQAVSAGRPLGGSALSSAQEALHHAVVSSRLRLTLRGQGASVSGVAFSPDGSRLATLSQDGSAKVWDVKSGRQLLTLPTEFSSPNVTHGIVFSPDGKVIATVTTPGGDRVALWDAKTGEAMPTTFAWYDGTINSMSFSPDSTRLATTSAYGLTIIWDVSSGKILFELMLGDVGGAAAFSPDGTRLVTTGCKSDACEADIWDATTGEKLHTLPEGALYAYAAHYSPDGKQFAIASSDMTGQIWDANSGQLLHRLIGHLSYVRGIAFSTDGRLVATSSQDGTAIIWDAASGNELFVLRGHNGPVWDVAFSPDGRSVATASGDGTARIWDVSPEGSSEWLTFSGHDDRVNDVRYAPDGTRIASSDVSGTVLTWDSASGQELLRVPGGGAFSFSRIAFSPDGKRLAVSNGAKVPEVWNSVTGQKLVTLAGNVPFVFGESSAIDYSPDGKYISTIDGTENTAVWDAESGEQIPRTSFTATAMAFSRDGKYLALALTPSDKTAIIDTQTWKVVLSLSGYTGTVNSISYSPDNKQMALAISEGTVGVWDAATGKELYTLYSHTSGVNAVAFSPESKYLAASVAGGVIKLWDLSQVGQPDAQPLSLYGHTKAVGPLSFSPDGKRLATGSDDGTVRIYALDLDDLIAIAKSRVTRALTPDECQEYLHVHECPPGP